MTVATAAAALALMLCVSCARVSAIRVDGSPALLPLVGDLASAYESRSDHRIVLASGLGSSARIEALARGRIDVAMASHGVDVAQLAAHGLVAHEIAYTAVVFAVHSAVALRAITREQVCDVLSGRLTRWRSFHVEGGDIIALTRPGDEVDAAVALQNIPCLREITTASNVRVIARPDSMAATLARTPGAFGVTSMTMVRASEGSIAALRLDGIAPTSENVTSGAYPLRRGAYLITRAVPSAAVRRFLDFIRGDDGARIIAAGGAVPAARNMRSP